MNIKHIGAYLVLCSVVVVLQPIRGLARGNADASKTSVQQTPAERDGQHDFEFEMGSWETHLKKVLHPLTGSTTWVEFDGTSVTRKAWDGRAQLEEFETNSPAAGHIEGLTLRLYNPQSHQWNLYWANSKDGALVPPQIGEFKNGRGEFFAQDTLNGKSIYVRFVWSNTNTNTPHFEQSFSDDGGNTWEVNWITDQTRISDEAAEAYPAPPDSNAANAGMQVTNSQRDGEHDFDTHIGSWKYHLKRRSHPLTGSTTWVESEGTGLCYKVWNGRAQLDTLNVDGPKGHTEGLTLRLYNPQSHQWSLYRASSKDGTINGPPNVGEFKNGRGEFYCQYTLNGRVVFNRYVWSNTTSNSAHFEESNSDDGGKTWEVDYVSDKTRLNEQSDKGR